MSLAKSRLEGLLSTEEISSNSVEAKFSVSSSSRDFLGGNETWFFYSNLSDSVTNNGAGISLNSKDTSIVNPARENNFLVSSDRYKDDSGIGMSKKRKSCAP